MTTRIITGCIYHPVGGAPWASGQVIFYLESFFANGAYTYPTEVYTVTTAADGTFTTSVAVPDTGTAYYRCGLPDGSNFSFNIGAGAAVALNDLIAITTAPVTPSALQLLIDAHAAIQSTTGVSAHAPFATVAETQAGALTTKAVNPATLKAYFKQAITIGETGVTEGKIILAAHKAGDAPIYLYNTNATFSSYEESIIGLGYNIGGEIANHHKFFMVFETDYKYSATPAKYACEWYIQINPTTGAAIRPFFTSVDRDTLIGVNYYSATTHYFTDVAGNIAFELDSGPPQTIWVNGNTQINHSTNNVRWLKQMNTSGVAVDLLYLNDSNLIVLGKSGYPIIPQADVQFYATTAGFVMPDRSDGHNYRIKITNGVLGTEFVS